MRQPAAAQWAIAVVAVATAAVTSLAAARAAEQKATEAAQQQQIDRRARADASIARIRAQLENGRRRATDAEGGSATAVDCARTALRRMAAPARMAESQYGLVIEAVQVGDLAEADRGYYRLEAYREAVDTAHAELMGCVGGSAKDVFANVNLDVQTGGGTVTRPGIIDDPLGELTVGIEQSKPGSPKAFD